MMKMKKIKLITAAIFMAVFVFLPQSTSAIPLTQFAKACTNRPVLGIPSWYKNLECHVDEDKNEYPKLTKLNDIWVVALNIVEALIIAAAYVAAGFIIWGGIKYIKSRGDPCKVAEAKTSILHAVVGLAVALASTVIARFVQELIK